MFVAPARQILNLLHEKPGEDDRAKYSPPAGEGAPPPEGGRRRRLGRLCRLSAIGAIATGQHPVLHSSREWIPGMQLPISRVGNVWESAMLRLVNGDSFMLLIPPSKAFKREVRSCLQVSPFMGLGIAIELRLARARRHSM